MNKIFKVIWNHATQSWVAVSELQKAKGKTKSSKLGKISILAISAGATLIGGQALAAYADGTMSNNSIALGVPDGGGAVDTVANGRYNIAIGKSANATTPIADRNPGAAIADNNGNAIAIGTNASALGHQTIAIGMNATAGGTTGNSQIAIGMNASASGQETLAVGKGAQASGMTAMAMGFNASASGAESISIGKDSFAVSPQSQAMGKDAQAVGPNSVALGSTSRAYGFGATALGDGASTIETNSTLQQEKRAALAAIMADTSLNDNARDVKIKELLPETATAVGYYSKAFASNATAVGRETEALAENATVLGSKAKANEVDTTVLGSNAIANVSGSVALGAGSTANRAPLGKITADQVTSAPELASEDVPDANDNLVKQIFAYGAYSLDAASDADKEAIAKTAKGEDGGPKGDTRVGAVSVGNDAVTRQIVNLAPGSADEDAVNVAQLKAVANVAMQGWKIGADGRTDVEGKHKVVTGEIPTGGRVDFVGTGAANVNVSMNGADANNAIVTIDVQPTSLGLNTGYLAGGAENTNVDKKLAANQYIYKATADATTTQTLTFMPGTKEYYYTSNGTKVNVQNFGKLKNYQDKNGQNVFDEIWNEDHEILDFFGGKCGDFVLGYKYPRLRISQPRWGCVGE